MTETGKLKKDKEDKKMREDHGKKLYKSWSKRNMMSFQTEGEFEDTKITDKAKSMFQNRRNRNFFPEKEKFDNGKGGNYKGKMGKGSKKIGKRELKTPNQIFKVHFLIYFYKI